MKPFILKHIEDLEFYTNEDIDYKVLDSKKLSISMSNELKLTSTSADMFMTIEYKDKESLSLLLKQKVKLTFNGDFTDCQTEESEQDNKEKKNNLKELSLEFITITIGTLRGMIYLKVRNNPFLSQQLLPVIPKNILQQSINENIDKTS